MVSTNNPTAPLKLIPDRDALNSFANVMFKNARRDGWVSFRTFRDNSSNERPVNIQAVRLDDHEFEPLMLIPAEQAANWNEPAVFAPPVCTFKDHRNAKTDNIREGVCISAECDQNPNAARRKLEALLGPATVAVESGGEWTNPETGEIENKVHLHWRLKRPASSVEALALLYQARALATKLVGGDPTCISIVHPLRWPGSWHRKKTPKLSRIVALNAETEIELEAALSILRQETGTTEPVRLHGINGSGQRSAASASAVAQALAVIPNGTDPLAHGWEYWNVIGMTVWASTNGSEEGRQAFHDWSSKSPKYNQAETNKRWDHYFRSPPNRLGFGSLVYRARAVDPTWHYQNPNDAGMEAALGDLLKQLMDDDDDDDDDEATEDTNEGTKNEDKDEEEVEAASENSEKGRQLPIWLYVMLQVPYQSKSYFINTVGPYSKKYWHEDSPDETYGPWADNEALLGDFLRRCVRANIADDVIISICINAKYTSDKAIHTYCREAEITQDKLKERITRAKEADPDSEDDDEAAPPAGLAPKAKGKGGITFDDFYAYLPQHTYIFAPVGEIWIGPGINARLPKMPMLKKDGTPVLDKNGKPKRYLPTIVLDKLRSVEQMTWAPGRGEIIKDQLISVSGFFPRQGANIFNLYKPPLPLPPAVSGVPDDPKPWLDHFHLIYPDEAPHMIAWMAHRSQRPAEKLNHAIVMGGNQGIGKDTLLEPLKRVVGPWNFRETTPSVVMGSFNPYLKGVVLRVSEARDLGEFDRFKFYDHTKSIIAAPPDVLAVNDKHLKEHFIVNVIGVIITTNHKSNGIYLPADDRRHYVAWSSFDKSMFDKEYWNRLWQWYAEGGLECVGRYLMNYDLTDFDPKAPPPQTSAFWEIVSASDAPEDAEMADALDMLARTTERARLRKEAAKAGSDAADVSDDEWGDFDGLLRTPINAEQRAERDRIEEQLDKAKLEWPDAVTIEQIQRATTSSSFGDYLKDRRNSRKIPYRFETCGYVPVRNPAAKDGLWKLQGARRVVYAKKDMTAQERTEAVQALEAGFIKQAADAKRKAAAGKARAEAADAEREVKRKADQARRTKAEAERTAAAANEPKTTADEGKTPPNDDGAPQLPPRRRHPGDFRR